MDGMDKNGLLNGQWTMDRDYVILPFFLLKANPSSFFPVFSVFSAIIPQNLLFCERFFMDDGQGQEWTRWTAEWTRMDC